jgi:GntR family transcriptional regulator, carbon starvation induced regulator
LKQQTIGLKGDLTALASERVRSDIISGALPPGSRLRIAALKESYGIGASPLREALGRLISEGIVRNEERRGFLVSPVSVQELRELVNLRKLLEKEALREALAKGDERWESGIIAALYRLGKLHAEFARGDMSNQERWEELNEEFHEALLAGSQSDWLLHFWRIVYVCMRRYRRMCGTLASPNGQAHEEHEALKQAALARDFPRIAALIDDHLEHTYTRFVERTRQTDAAMHMKRTGNSPRPIAAAAATVGKNSLSL